MQVPLFPLNTVLFPGGPLPLRIFETRYVDMISRCVRDNSSFGVVLIREGTETSGAPKTAMVGTLAHVVDWYQGSDGLLGVTAIGTERFRLRSIERNADHLNCGEIELLPLETPMALPEDYAPLAEILKAIMDDLGRLYESAEEHLDDAGWVANRLMEILPIALEQKQAALEGASIQERLELVRSVLHHVHLPDAGGSS